MDQASGGVAEMMMLMTEKVKVKVKMRMRMRMRMKRHLENERVDEHTSVV